MTESSEEKVPNGERYFKLVKSKIGDQEGRFTGRTPKQAASKAFTKLLMKAKENSTMPDQSTKIFIKESTRGSKQKIYGFEAKRVELDQPQELTIMDKSTGQFKTISYKYRNEINRLKNQDKSDESNESNESSKPIETDSELINKILDTNKISDTIDI
jgi:hypothetical protein